MKIIELEIKNIRGIKDLTLSPNGKTIVVWGPNGTGKSGVIDSVDFLLTGKVTRLTGKGTQNLSLKTHGSHIDSSGDDAYVKAKIQIDGIEEPIELFREISNPNQLEINGCDKKLIAPILSIAERGQHVLTRREILEYITSEPSSRAQQIQMLLNVNEIEKIRKNFVKISNKASKGVDATHKALEQAKFGLLSTTQDESYTDEAILKFINSYRKVLNGLPIQELNSSSLKIDISSPKLVKSTNADNNISLIEKHIQNILQIIDKQETISSKDLSLKNAINKVQESPELAIAFRRKNLITLGIEAVNTDELKDCPLCDAEWEELKLNEYLRKKLNTIDTLSQYNKTIEDNISFFKKEGNLLLSNLERISNIVKIVPELEEFEQLLGDWENLLKTFIESLEAPLTSYLKFDSKNKKIANLFAPSNIDIVLEKILATLIQKFPKSSLEQNAWDTLTRLEENIKAIELSEIEYSNTKFLANRANTLSFEFEKSRDKILNELYEKIQERFVALYRDLHGDDEKDFTAKLEPKGAALNFEVNFHGRGSHPPHALHSEGHQDSMGLCLFLALSEYLAKGIVDILLLDDVVMSVDSEHRRSLCKLIVSHFPNKQFIITTHDKTWANQLKTEGIVTSKTSIEFYNWHIDSGPHVNLEKDLWKDIKSALNENDIPEGAAKLRRASESFFEALCDSLEASIIYRQSRRWELGNFMPPAYKQFKKLLKIAKNAAHTWGDEEQYEYLKELESTSGQIYKRTQAEFWGVNTAVHYNAWATFNANDFQPIADSFEDLFNLFLCPKCKGMIRLVKNEMTEEAVKCNCGGFNWNLTAKRK